MLDKFITEQRELIIARTREKVAAREAPRATELELKHGVPLFLDQLSDQLRRGIDGNTGTIGDSASLRGAELLKTGLTVGQVVHDYGNICQAVTEVAVELGAPISTEDFRTLNLCLDVAIAEAVTEFSRQREENIRGKNVEQLGLLAHELRNFLNSATLAYQAVRSGTVGPAGSTSDILGRSLSGIRDLIDRSLAEVRLTAGQLSHRERIQIAVLLEELEITAAGHASSRSIQLSIEPVAADVTVDADYQILASILMNLVQNACKYTRERGHVTLRTRVTADTVSMEVADECGGLPDGKTEELFRPFEQRGSDRSGLGLGLSISLRGARALGGELQVRNMPGVGCAFTLDLPRSAGSPGSRPLVPAA